MSKKKVTTQVHELPDDPQKRTKFLDGVKQLAEECGANWVAGSVHDEMAYADVLAKELENEVSDMYVEDLRQRFEKGQIEACP